ncbi:BlaI/MecI/CopY family transcriptional regulator [Oceanirhabdus sp. W0125-5]|uniref:BlaI/MecI/CopY family transcriptional regulator n=1 Tax=Oceanirhabdus sp. W0125-5 TaxID=2999116 RepID=UPI0022F337CD|nr:BlaI/MecI/CopY family transcriptional regulator [Oceanirhabdus sp. W0125-5]WBW97411.1 BlaI/MecI/CopY family transcriptional regulator [Oceanirhabdus sp. W0125-5]
MKNTLPKISDSELEVMKIIWETNPIKAKQINELLSKEKDWTEQTIKTLINRLLKKEAISFKKEGRTYLYSPLISEKDYINKESRSFLQKFYDGSLNAMFSYFIKDKSLSKNDIEELKKLLDEGAQDD